MNPSLCLAQTTTKNSPYRITSFEIVILTLSEAEGEEPAF